MNLDFGKYADGLIPAIVQDANTGTVLMLGFMNEDALKKTQEIKKVTFYSRSKKRLWTKGEESGNFLNLIDILPDCDNDTLLIKAIPTGPVCHTGQDTCFNEKNEASFIFHLEEVIAQRKESGDEASYTKSLFDSGMNRIAQKVGEEAVEVVIEAMRDKPERFINEASDLLFHYLVLLQAKGKKLADVAALLKTRHK